MFKPLDPLLHTELRLAVMSLLISAEEAETKVSVPRRQRMSSYERSLRNLDEGRGV